MSEKTNKSNLDDGKTKISFHAYTSFEEENQAQYQRWRAMTPEQRLEEHRILSLIIFGDNEKYIETRLTFE